MGRGRRRRSPNRRRDGAHCGNKREYDDFDERVPLGWKSGKAYHTEAFARRAFGSLRGAAIGHV